MAGNAAPDPLIGHLIAGKYAVIDVLAKGGMGVIYRAEQKGLGRVVALKMLNTKRERDETFEQRFSLEAATLAKLKHPNTVTIYDYGFAEAESQYFMAMEFVEGENLARIVKTEGPFAPARALKLIYECARALAEAHGAGIVHRDLKPANIMLVRTSEGESIKILDFGIAKLIQPDPDRMELTSEQMMLGSPKFMAPEQIRAGRLVDARTDVYSLGAVLFYLLSGTEPFHGETQVQVLMAHLSQPVPSLAKMGAKDVPAQVEAIVRKCLEKEQADRYASMDDLKTAIRGALAELEGGVTNPTLSRKLEFTGESAKPEPASQRPVALLAAIAAVVLLLTVGAGVIAVAALGVGVGVATTTDSPAVDAPVTPPTAAVATPEPAPEPPPPPAPAPRLTITSEPVGAEVFEAGGSLGATPLTLDWVAAADPRSLELRFDGYEPATLAMGAIESDTRQHVSLVKKATAPKPAGKPAPKPPKPDGGGDDLLMER